MDDRDSTLWTLEEQFWLGGEEAYRRRLADDSLMVLAGTFLTKPQTLASIAHETRWTSVRFTDRRLVRLSPDVVALAYRASASRAGEAAAYTALVSSVYVRHGQDGWKLALHQQSPER